MRVVFEHADRLLRRGWDATVVSPDPPPDWYPLESTYRTIDLADPSSIPKSDVAVGTYWTTIRAAIESGAKSVFHFSQGWEGVHPEHAPILPQIDEVYRLPIPKLLVSAHLMPVLSERYGCRCHLIGQAIDREVFTPGPFRENPKPLRVGVIGHWGIRPKGINELLLGLKMTREAGFDIEVLRASAGPYEEGERLLGVTDLYFQRLTMFEMSLFYRNLDVYLHPSWDEEGFPLPPLEAMASGVAVGLTPIRSFAPIPADAALRFPWNSPESIPPLFEKLFDPAVRRSLREAAFRILPDYTHDKVIDRLEAAIATEGGPKRG
jgi:glycosyltransferase involved in cell wall biosynthesis